MEALLNMYENANTNRKSTKKRRLENSSTAIISEINFTSQEVQTVSCDVDPNEVSILFGNNIQPFTQYYQFLFGALIPLVEYNLVGMAKTYRIVTDVGPMKVMLTELPLNISEICGPPFSSSNAGPAIGAIHDKRSAAQISLPSYDIFDGNVFNEPTANAALHSLAKEKVLDYFYSNIPSYVKQTEARPILVIEQPCCIHGVSDTSTKRSIGNYREMVAALVDRFGPAVLSVSLERVGIFYQVQLFAQSSVVIAQHGDVLANAFFMRSNRSSLSDGGIHNLNKIKGESISSSGGSVVEILPPSGGENSRYRNLAAYCQLRYESVTEDSGSGEVNVDQVVKLVESLFHATDNNKL